jgi:hypothetical protein
VSMHSASPSSELSLSDLMFVKDPDMEGVQEVKLWDALTGYGKSFEDTDGDGVPDMPVRYLSPEERLIFIESE